MLGWDKCLAISGWTSEEGLMKGFNDCYYVYLVSPDELLCHTRQATFISHHAGLSFLATMSKPYPFHVGHILQAPKLNFLTQRAKDNSWWKSYKHMNLPLPCSCLHKAFICQKEKKIYRLLWIPQQNHLQLYTPALLTKTAVSQKYFIVLDWNSTDYA